MEAEDIDFSEEKERYELLIKDMHEIMRAELLSGESLRNVVETLLQGVETGDSPAVYQARKTLYAQDIVLTLFEQGLSPTTISDRTEQPLKSVRKQLKGRSQGRLAVSPPVSPEGLRTLEWYGCGRNPLKLTGFWDSSQPVSSKGGTYAYANVQKLFYSEEMVDHLTEGELSGFTPAWRVEAVNICVRNGSASSVSARNTLNRILRRWEKSPRSYLQTFDAISKDSSAMAKSS